MSHVRVSTAILPLLVLVAAASGSPASATSASAAEPFLLTGRYVLETDEKPDPTASIFLRQGESSLVVRCASLPSPVLVDPKTGQVRPLDPGMVLPEGDEALRVLAGAAAPGSLATVVPEGAWARFEVGGHAYRLGPAPFVIGTVTGRDLLGASPEYRREAAAYEPAPEYLATLRSQESPVRLDVFFGTWCGFCSRHLPRLLRVLQESENPRIQAVFHGMPRKISLDPGARAAGVSAVPTALISIGGREVGRLEGQAWRQPEVALATLLESLR